MSDQVGNWNVGFLMTQLNYDLHLRTLTAKVQHEKPSSSVSRKVLTGLNLKYQPFHQQGYKTFFKLNSTEYVIQTAHKCYNRLNQLNCQLKPSKLVIRWHFNIHEQDKCPTQLTCA